MPLPPFDFWAMPDVQLWLEFEGEGTMFFYGDDDPWSMGMYRMGWAHDSYRYVVPAGTHFSSIYDLRGAELEEAIDALERWSGVPVDRDELFL